MNDENGFQAAAIVERTYDYRRFRQDLRFISKVFFLIC